MSQPALPQCCSPEAFALLSKLAGTIDSPSALVQGAVAIARHQFPASDPAAADHQIQAIADAVRQRVRGRQPQAILAHLHDVLFQEEGFLGNQEDYYDPANSYLPSVLSSHRGLPITLSLVYKSAADRLGLRTWGVALPGHFLVAVAESPETILLVDAFAQGRTLSTDEARQRVDELFGPDLPWSDDMLQPASNRHWLTRILQNLLHIFGTRGQYADVAAMLELEMLLWPREEHLQRDLALVLARLGMVRPASAWLDSYLRANPDDPRKVDLQQLLEVLSN